MTLKRKALPKRICPVCGTRFQPTKKGQIYDKRTICGMKAYRFRVAQKLERLEQLEARAQS